MVKLKIKKTKKHESNRVWTRASSIEGLQPMTPRPLGQSSIFHGKFFILVLKLNLLRF